MPTRIRLFVAVWPPPAVVDALSSLTSAAVSAPASAPVDGARWTQPGSWHVTLRFLGSVDEALVGDVGAALEAVTLPPAVAHLGPATECFGRSVLVVPVDGLDGLASVVVAATAGFGEPPPEDRPFRGHLTLARSRLGGRGRGRQSRSRRGPDLRRLAGLVVPPTEPWAADEVTLVRSAGGRYEVLATVVR